MMQRALAEATTAGKQGEVPVGAVIVNTKGAIIAASGNYTERLHDATAHAEIMVLREAGKILGTPRLTECDLYVTLEPCPMCAHAISMARIRRLYFGAYDPKSGGVEHGPRIFESSSCHHIPEIYGGIEEAACSALLKDFFAAKR